MSSDTPANSRNESSVLKTYEEYLLASFSLDEKRVATYYNEPFMFVSAEKTVTVATRAEAEAFLKPGFKALQQSGYAKTEFPILRSQSLGKGLAIISGMGIRFKTDGVQLASFGITYIWRQAPDGWKLAVMTVHDAAIVLRLE